VSSFYGIERGCLRVLGGRKAAYSREWMDRLATCIGNSWDEGGEKRRRVLKRFPSGALFFFISFIYTLERGE